MSRKERTKVKMSIIKMGERLASLTNLRTPAIDGALGAGGHGVGGGVG